MTLLRDVFGQFCAFGSGKSGPDNEMDGVKFGKLCRDCKLLDAKFTAADADLIHSKSRAAGARRLDFTAFKETALPLIAAKKGWTTKEVIERIKQAGGPLMACTVPEAVKLYDDKAMHTGTAGWKAHQGVASSTGPAAEPVSPTSPKNVSPRKVRSMRKARGDPQSTPTARGSSPKSGGRGSASPKSGGRGWSPPRATSETDGGPPATAVPGRLFITPNRQVSFTYSDLDGEAKGVPAGSPTQAVPASPAGSSSPAANVCVVHDIEAARHLNSLGPGDGTYRGLAIEVRGQGLLQDILAQTNGSPEKVPVSIPSLAALAPDPHSTPAAPRPDRPGMQPLPLSTHPEEDGACCKDDWLVQRRDLEGRLRTAQALLGLYQAQCAQLCTCLATAGISVPWHAVRWSREEVEGYFSHVAGLDMTEAQWKQWVQLLPSPLKPLPP
eukprot:EG_transcript_9014